jgi:hypothetical protein
MMSVINKKKIEQGCKSSYVVAMITIISATILLFSCSDSYENLGNGYFYRHEGGLSNDILCESSKGGFIPATVIAYSFDDNFIIAKQKPKIPQDLLYNKEFSYPKNKQNEYYWIILKKNNSVLGPLNFKNYIYQRNKNHIPRALKFN